MFAIYQKEINAFFNSLIGYLVIIVFLSFIGLYMWVFPDYNVFDLGFADMQTLFTFGPLAFMFLIPAITMRSFAEEKKDGTIELLLTRPVTDWQIIGGKYLACLTLVVFSLAPTLVYYFSLYILGNPEGNIDSAGVFSSYLGLILLGAVFTAVGIFSSVISGNQIVAFILSVILIYFLYDGITRLATLGIFEGMTLFLTSFGLDHQYYSMGKGLIDSRNVLYFVSCIAVFLMSTKVVMGSRQWE